MQIEVAVKGRKDGTIGWLAKEVSAVWFDEGQWWVRVGEHWYGLAYAEHALENDAIILTNAASRKMEELWQMVNGMEKNDDESENEYGIVITKDEQ